MNVNLNDDQKLAVDKIGDFFKSRSSIFVLTGGPGTGKTFMLKEAMDIHKGNKVVICGTIAHAARNVLSEALDGKYPCFTIAQLLGMSMKIDEATGECFFYPSRKMPKRIKEASNGILILDEISMIDDELYQILLNEIEINNIKCIAVGDPFQLPPVKQDHDSKFFDKIDATLTIPMRFKGPVANLATVYHDAIYDINITDVVNRWVLNEKTNRKSDIQDNVGYEFLNNLTIMLDRAADDIKSNPDNKNFTRVLAFKNSVVDGINDEIRKRIYGTNLKQFEEGEIVICNGGYSAKNQSILYNGQILRVEDYEPVKDHYTGIPALRMKFKGMSMKDMPTIYTIQKSPKAVNAYNEKKKYLLAKAQGNPTMWGIYKDFLGAFAHFTYGYAQNLYKVQGTTLNNVYVCEGGVMDVKPLTYKQKFQALYVAMTRAKEKVFIYNKNF